MSPRHAAWILMLAAACGHDPPAKPAVRDAGVARAPDAALAPIVHRPDVDWGTAEPDAPPPTGALPGSFVAASTDGKRLASVEGTHFLRIRDAGTLAILVAVPLCLAGKTGARTMSACPASRYPMVRALAFSPDGAGLAIACDGCATGPSLHVIDLPAGTLRFATALASAPGDAAWGDALAVGLADAILLLDPVTGDERKIVAEPARRIATDASAYLSGSRIVSLIDGSARDTRAGDTIIPLPAGAGHVVVDSHSARRFGPTGEERGDLFSHAGSSGAVTTADGRHVLALDSSSTRTVLHLIDLDTERLILEEPLEPGANLYAGGYALGPTGAVYVPSATAGVRRVERRPVAVLIAVAPSGERMVAVEEVLGGGYLARIRDTTEAMAETGSPVSISEPTGAAFSPDERQVALGDGSAVVIAPGRLPPVALDFPVRAIAWGPDRLIAMGTGRVVAIHPRTGAVTPLATDETLEGIAPDASAYCVRAQQPAYETGKPGGGRQWVVPPAKIDCISIGSGKRRTVVGDTRGAVVPLTGGGAVVVDGALLDLHDADGRITAHIEHPFTNDVAHATTADGRWVAQIDGAYAVLVFDTQAQQIVLRHPTSTRPRGLAVAPDGTVFVGLEGGGTLRLQRR